MKNFDNHIREIFSEKLGNFESEVSPHVWSGIESQLAGAAPTATTVAGKSLLAKIVWAAAIGIAGTVTTVALLVNSAEEATTVQSITQVQPDQAQNEPAQPEVITTEPQTNASNTQAERGIDHVQATPVDKPRSTHIEASAPSVGSTSYTQPGSEANHDPMKEPTSQNTTQPGEHGTTGYTGVQPASPVHHSEQEPLTAKFTPSLVEGMRYFFIPQQNDAKSYEWNFGDGFTSSEMSPSHSYEEESDYTVSLSVTSQDGRTARHEHVVKPVSPSELLIPTVFTPDGDGKNDQFLIKVISGEVQLTKIVILNNEGSVFESDGQVMWDGRLLSGDNAPTGSYTYLVRGHDRNQAVIEKTGRVTLLR